MARTKVFRCLKFHLKMAGIARRRGRVISGLKKENRDLRAENRWMKNELAHSHAREKLARLGVPTHGSRAVS